MIDRTIQNSGLLLLLKIISLVLFSQIATIGQGSLKQSLLIVSCNSEKNCTEETLHKFTFQDGNYISREELNVFPLKNRDDGFRRSLLFENRYIVSDSGRVYDLMERARFEKETGRFVAYDNGKIIINQFAGLRGLDFFDIEKISSSDNTNKTVSFDLSTKKYESYSGINFFSTFAGSFSPGIDKRVAYLNLSKLVILHRKGKDGGGYTKETLDGSFKASCGKKCQKKDFTAPAIWVDNDRLLTQVRNGELVIYSVSSHKQTSLEKIEVSNNIDHLPLFYADDDGNIFYLADETYRIDTESGKHTLTKAFGLGNGFKRVGLGDNKMFMFKDQKLAAFTSGYSKTTDGYLAAEFQDEPLMKSDPLGIRVWSVATGKWTKISVNYMPRIIGWLSE